jgi:hypothetical protein
METAVTRQSKQSMQSIQNREYVRRLLRQKQPGA